MINRPSRSNSPSGRKPRSSTGRVAKGYRILHMPIPERIFHHAKAQSHLSCLRFSEYVARILERAQPINIEPDHERDLVGLTVSAPDSSGDSAATKTTAPPSSAVEESDVTASPSSQPPSRNREVDS